MSDRKFVKFEEYNDHEGEHWFFFLQWDGNENSLELLAELISAWELALDAECDYRVHWENQDDWFLTEAEVDTLVKHSPRGYLHVYNKVEGKMEGPDILEELFGSDDMDWDTFDSLYKGGITDLFTK